MSPGPVHAGDVLRAAGALGITDAQDVLALVRAMGLPNSPLRSAGLSSPADRPRQPMPDSGSAPGAEAPGRRPTARRPDVTRGHGAPAAPGPALPAPSGGSLLSFSLPESLDASLEEAGEQPLPAGEILFGSPGEARERPPAPPWNPRTERAIMHAVAATEAVSREVDRRRLIALVIRRLGGHPLTGDRPIPYRLRPTTRAGLHLLLDRGPSMRPFRHDHLWVARLAHQVLPPDQLRVLDFRLTQGVSTDGGHTWSTTVRLTPGTPVLLVSDLGYLRPPVAVRHQASPADWFAFLKRLRRAGHPVTCLTPFRPETYPAAVRRTAALVPLDRRTSAWSARAQVRQVRRSGRTA